MRGASLLSGSNSTLFHAATRVGFDGGRAGDPRKRKDFPSAAASVAALLCFVLCLTSTPASAVKPPTSANGTHTFKGELNAHVNGALSIPPSYLPATRISAGPSGAVPSSSNASSAVECFKRCAVALSATNASVSCYGATFTPATSSCSLFSGEAASPTTLCPALILEMAAASSSALFPSRYSKVAESCITSGPKFKDGPPFEVPSAQEGADAAAGIAIEGISAAVVQGATIFETSTTLTYIGTVGNMVSPAVCTGLCQRYKRGSEWRTEPTNFTGTWAAAAGYAGVPEGPVASDCIASSHYDAAAAYQEADDRFEYVCDLWGAPAAGTLAAVELQPQEPGGRNSASVLITSRWKALPRT